jgi:subtilisin-like proprotein convertase family protein
MDRPSLASLACLLFAFSPSLAGGPLPAEPGSAFAADAALPEGRVVVKFTDDSRVRLRSTGLVSLGGADLGDLHALMAAFDHPRPERLFLREERDIDRDLAAAERRSGRDLADLNGYYEMVVAPELLEPFLVELEALAVVQTAYPAPRPAPPPGDIPPTTPDFEGSQGYLDAAPGGIDARAAWASPGGRGDGVSIIDIEYDWNDTHEDLEAALGGKVCWTPKGNWIDHGTAVLGELGGGENGYGVTGIVPSATLGMATQDPVGLSNSVARAIDCATGLQGPGDVMLLEAQTGGPNGAYVPVEWNQAEFDAISAATAKGIVVVEAAGNGNEDLDGPEFLGRFDRSVRDSGAIIVGAGASPGSGQPDRSRLSFSTHGSRVDVQGWGHNVTTTGYGGLFDGGGDPDQYYTATFSGTSSASPIVTGAAAAVQGVQLARGADPLDPLELRTLLTETGTPQQDGPYTGHIGPRPDLAAALATLADLYVVDRLVEDAAPLGNENGLLEPGETATLRVTVENAGGETAGSLAGRLSAEREDLVKVTGADALWPDLAGGQSAETLAPHFRLTLQPDATCGETLGLPLVLTSDPYREETALALEVGQLSGVFESADTPLAIPKKSSAGVSSTVDVPEAFTIENVQASVDISHGGIDELLVLLRSPSGTEVTLHDHGGAGTADLVTTYDRDTAPAGPGSMSDFDGEPAQGSWSLLVVDDQGGANPAGTLNAWSLELLATAPFRCEPLACGEPVPGTVDDSLRLDRVGADLEFGWQAQPGAASYRVWRSATPQMEGTSLVGQASGTSLVVPDEAGGPGGSLVHYQLRAVNACEWEGP